MRFHRIMAVILFLLALIHVAGLVIILFSARKAPYGYEDDAGFHKTEDQEAATSQPVA